jgi:hypothetical protein
MFKDICRILLVIIDKHVLILFVFKEEGSQINIFSFIVCVHGHILEEGFVQLLGHYT